MNLLLVTLLTCHPIVPITGILKGMEIVSCYETFPIYYIKRDLILAMVQKYHHYETQTGWKINQPYCELYIHRLKDPIKVKGPCKKLIINVRDKT